MQTIDEMIADVIRREGGYVDHPDDRGGPTKYGITQKTLSRYKGYSVLTREVKNLTVEVAAEIYEQNYFLGPSIHKLPNEIQPFVFDSAVNHGPRRALKFVQSVCNQAGYTPALVVDGAMGPNTRRGAEWCQQQMEELFLQALCEERRNFYYLIVANNPSQKVFLKGWMNRLADFGYEEQLV